jgi:3-oxoacyl-[acyl-carrier protein] reductase
MTDLNNIVFPSLKDRVVIITGAGQGIGRTFAKAFATAGARVVIAELNEQKAAAVSEEIMKAGGEAFAVTTDVADDASIKEMVEVVEDEYGRIDVLINNAGIFSTLEMRPFDQIPLDEWEKVLRVNLTGPFLCARAVLPAMRRAKWGRIINIASGAVRLGRPNYLHYVASKAALGGMSLSMAREVGGDGITVKRCRRNKSSASWRCNAFRVRKCRRISSAPRCSWRRTLRPSSPARASTSTAA